MLTLRRILLAAAVLSAAACDEEAPFCGDGKLNEGEECDDGNADDSDYCLSSCKARRLSSLTIKWEFNSVPESDFSGDACIDMHARKVEVEITGGPEPLVLSENCSFKQVVFIDIPAATYTAKLRVLDADDIPLTASDAGQAIVFPGGSATEVLIVPPSRWLQSYLGTFFFRTSWAQGDCTTALPPVAQQRLTLVAGGQVFSGNTTDGAALDGSSPAPCQSTNTEFPQAVLDVPFGPATFTVEGLESDGSTAYESVYQTFVGAGVNNPELFFDVELLAP